MDLSVNMQALHILYIRPDDMVYVANMRPIWGRQDPGGPHVGPMNFAIRASFIGFMITAKLHYHVMNAIWKFE